MRSGEVVADRYRLEDLVGAGGMGVVWRATDLHLKRVVAVKHATPGRGERDAELLHREAQNAARVHHANAVTLFDSVREGAECWLIMEYFESTSLDKILAKEHVLPPEQVAHIGVQIAEALAALHANGIVHRDIKPGNILVAGDGTAKLTDFGISRWSEATLTQTGALAWTPAYGAPEVGEGKAATPASDVFSLGATLFHAVEGVLPFGAGSSDLRLESSFGMPTIRRAGPLGLVLSELLRHKAKDRPTAERARDMLKEVSGESTLPVRPTRPVEAGEQLTVPVGARKSVPPVKRHRRKAVVAGIGVVVVAILVGVWAVAGFPWSTATVSAPTPAASAPTLLPAVGDPRTVDSCKLTDAAALRKFGPAHVDADYGNFNRCDVLVDMGDQPTVDVQVQFEIADGTGQVVSAGSLSIEQLPPSNGTCLRRVRLASPVMVTINAKVKGNTTADLCAISDVAAASAADKLRSGEVPRRSAPIDAASLANVDACGLLDGNAFSPLPDVDATNSEPGFGNWECTWYGTTGARALFVRFSQGEPGNDKNSTTTRLGDYDAVISPHNDGSCDVNVLYRPYLDVDRKSKFEQLLVTLYGSQPSAQLCGMATDIAASAAANLPRR